MSNLSVFFNNRVEFNNPPLATGCDVLAFVFDSTTRSFGDWLFTPVRCLFNGNQVDVDINESTAVHAKIYGNEYKKSKRNLLRIVLAIMLFVPGVLLGTLFKSISLFSSDQRKKHKFAVLHFTRLPVEKTTVGTEKNPLDLKEIDEALQKIKKENKLNRKANAIIIYAKPGTTIKEDPGILDLHPKKIILSRARLINGPSHSTGPMLDYLNGWELKSINSVSAAISDKPTRKTFFSMTRKNCIYNC